jgi:hypothetical protein
MSMRRRMFRLERLALKLLDAIAASLIPTPKGETEDW